MIYIGTRTIKKEKADFEYWKGLPEWSFMAAAFLLNGLEPPLEVEALHENSWRFDTDDDELRKKIKETSDSISDAARRYRVFGRPSPFSSNTVKPRDVVKWAHGKGLPVPDELLELIGGVIETESKRELLFLDPEHPNYTPLLDIAVETWLHLFGKGDFEETKSPKDQIVEYLIYMKERGLLKYDISPSAMGLIATLINPRRRGGRPRSDE